LAALNDFVKKIDFDFWEFAAARPGCAKTGVSSNRWRSPAGALSGLDPPQPVDPIVSMFSIKSMMYLTIDYRWTKLST
jgi:hypothetical protein